MEGALSDPVAVEKLVEWFESSLEESEAARKLAERDRDYYDHKQLTSEEKATLADRGQPDVVVNRIQPKINYLIGFEAVNRTDPKAQPRNPQDEAASEAVTDALRYVSDATALPLTFSAVWENMLIEGYGGLELVIEEKSGKREIGVNHWDWDRLFYDPHSRKHDFSDARYMGGVVWMDEDDALAMWPDGAEVIGKTLTERASDTHDDRPSYLNWTSGKARKRVRIVQMYYREGRQWWLCKFTKGGKLESMPVPFINQDGESWCPMFLQSAFVDRKNARYGLTRQMIDVQDEINKRRSKALHLLSVFRTRMEAGAVDDPDLARRELAKPDALLVTNPGFQFEVLRSDADVAGQINLLQEAKNEIELMGPNASMQGKEGSAASGRAILANRQGGQTEITVILDRHRHLKYRTHKGIWDLIRQYKDEEWWVRVTDDQGKAKFVGFNRPVTAGEEMAKQLEQHLSAQGAPPEAIQMQVQQQMQAIASDPMQGPMLGQVVRMENVPAQMHMDIEIEDVPDTANVMQEQFEALTKLAPAVVFPPRVYIEASALRNKAKLVELIEKPQQPNPEIEAFQKTKADLELRNEAAKAAKAEAETQKIQVDTVIAANTPPPMPAVNGFEPGSSPA